VDHAWFAAGVIGCRIVNRQGEGLVLDTVKAWSRSALKTLREDLGKSHAENGSPAGYSDEASGQGRTSGSPASARIEADFATMEALENHDN